MPAEPTPASGSEPPRPQVELVTRTGCHLCEAARSTLTEVTARHGLTWTERTLEAEPELAARFAEEVPVLLIDGVQRDFWVIDPVRLERLLTW